MDVGLARFRQTCRCAASAVSVARRLLFGSTTLDTAQAVTLEARIRKESKTHWETERQARCIISSIYNLKTRTCPFPCFLFHSAPSCLLFTFYFLSCFATFAALPTADGLQSAVPSLLIPPPGVSYFYPSLPLSCFPLHAKASRESGGLFLLRFPKLSP